MSKLISDVTLAILALVCISSCNRERVVRDNIVQLQSRPVVLPCDSMRLISHENRVDTFPKPFYWVVYSDSVDCSTCRLTNLLHWGDFIHTVRSTTDSVGFRFIFSPSDRDMGAFLCAAGTLKLSSQIYLDSLNVFSRQNPHVPNGVLYHTFLIDGTGNVLLVGDPVRNSDVNKLFWELVGNGRLRQNQG